MSKLYNSKMPKLEKKVPKDLKKFLADLEKLGDVSNLLDSSQDNFEIDSKPKQNFWGTGIYR